MKKKTTTGGNWWDKLGKPQYGGEIVIRASRNIENFDPYFSEGPNQHIWRMDGKAGCRRLDIGPCNMGLYNGLASGQVHEGPTCESWEFTNQVLMLSICEGNSLAEYSAGKWPGVYRRRRCISLQPSIRPWMVGLTNRARSAQKSDFEELLSVNALTGTRWSLSGRQPTMSSSWRPCMALCNGQCLENPEAVKKWGDVRDWHHAIGTGPFILKDFISDKSATLIKNPDYWGYDERYPQNKLPYADTIKYLIIPDDATALAAMRAGKIDIMIGVSYKQAQEMRKTNPEILQIPNPGTQALTLQPRNDKPPFNDIRVRKAMQMALDLPAIAKATTMALSIHTPPL